MKIESRLVQPSPLHEVTITLSFEEMRSMQRVLEFARANMNRQSQLSPPGGLKLVDELLPSFTLL